ncbi:hypothetical protein [Brevundimonas sp.]|uniref:hypothetical protein n=1 Tax=Brevundimonas sp. TaxID=1871086 RepID=UPI002FC7A612
MRIAAAVLLGFALVGCRAEPTKAQQSSPSVTLTNLSGAPVPSFDGRLVIGDGLSVFGLVARGVHETDPGIVVVEMLDSQTSSQMRIRDAKIDAMSFIYEVDCASLRYRLAGQTMYERSGQPIARTHIDNVMIEELLAPLQAACGGELTSDWKWGTEFTSMEGFLSAADPILEPRRTALPTVTITSTPRAQD